MISTLLQLRESKWSKMSFVFSCMAGDAELGTPELDETEIDTPDIDTPLQSRSRRICQTRYNLKRMVPEAFTTP